MTNRLIVVGTGIQVGHLTAEARGWISCADKVLYCVSDAVTERLIFSLSDNCESLFKFYGESKPRQETYREMVERTLECVREYDTVCVAYYGHPGFFVYPSHKAIELARAEGFYAHMCPGVSSLDCLICDLGIDPAGGLQIFEATDFMVRRRQPDTSVHLVLLQVSSLGDLEYSFNGFDLRNLPSLSSHLLNFYPSDFIAKAYHASHYPVAEPAITELRIEELANQKSGMVSTIYIPPIARAPIHLEVLEEYRLMSLLDQARLVPLNADLTTRLSK